MGVKVEKRFWTFKVDQRPLYIYLIYKVYILDTYKKGSVNHTPALTDKSHPCSGVSATARFEASRCIFSPRHVSLDVCHVCALYCTVHALQISGC